MKSDLIKRALCHSSAFASQNALRSVSDKARSRRSIPDYEFQQAYPFTSLPVKPITRQNDRTLNRRFFHFQSNNGASFLPPFEPRVCSMIAVKRQLILLRFDWLTGLIGAFAMVTLKPRIRASGSCPAGCFCRAGLGWCGGWRRITSEIP